MTSQRTDLGISFADMIYAYFRWTQPAFTDHNTHLIDLTSSFLPLLATKAWINRGTVIPATFFIAVTGYPRSGKTAYLKSLRRLLPSSIQRIPTGSPEYIVQAIGERRHGIMFYDEISHLEKTLSRYMDTFMPVLNNMYYLYDLDMGRRDDKKSVFVPAEEYFVDVIFAGTPDDWEGILLKAVGGFARRILRVQVHGRIPLFEEDGITLELEKLRAEFQAKIKKTLDALTHINLKMIIRGLKGYAPLVEQRIQDPEKQSLVEEYSYKYLAGKLLAHLITIDRNVSAEDIDTAYILHKLEENCSKIPNIDITIYNSTADSVDVDILYSAPSNSTLERFLPPNFTDSVISTLISIVLDELAAPSDIVLKNAQKIRQHVEETGTIIVSYRNFVRDILKLRSAQEYRPLIELLEDAAFIRVYDNPSRPGKLVILDPSAPICGNCAFFKNPDRCPLLQGVSDPLLASRLVKIDGKPCPKFIVREKYEEMVMPDE